MELPVIVSETFVVAGNDSDMFSMGSDISAFVDNKMPKTLAQKLSTAKMNATIRQVARGQYSWAKLTLSDGSSVTIRKRKYPESPAVKQLLAAFR